MRGIITTVMIFLVGFMFAGRKSELAIGFKIISDTTDASVEKGKCLITGVALMDGEVVAKARVYSQHARAVTTNAKGEFRILIDTADQYLTINKGDNYQGYIEGYKFKGGHLIECEVFVRDWSEMLIVDKPVIYLYSEEKTKVDLSLQTDMELTFTYPVISVENKWEVEVGPEGIETNQDESYPYLFWEAKTTDLTYKQFQTALVGELVATDSLVEYLENKLVRFGLNQSEKTDFITYWAPRMIQYNYVITQFSQDEFVEEIASLIVNPQPDSKKRVFMLFTGFDEPPTIELISPSSIERFERTGFTLLEWGGTEVSKENLYKTL